MFSQLARHTSTILRRSHPFMPWPPSSLGALHLSPISRVYSWSSQSQPANWSHLNDIYSRQVDVKPRESPMSPEERWAMQSRARNLMPPRGPYAGNAVLSLESHDFLIYHPRTECRGEKRERCRRSEQATVHLTEEQGCLRAQAG